MPDREGQIELRPIDTPDIRPSEEIPHPRARYFEIQVDNDNLSTTTTRSHLLRSAHLRHMTAPSPAKKTPRPQRPQFAFFSCAPTAPLFSPMAISAGKM